MSEEYKLNRNFIKEAVETGKTPEDLLQELADSGIRSVNKLYVAIRGLYEKQAYPQKLIEQLKANRKRPVLAAPQEVVLEEEQECEKVTVPSAPKAAAEIVGSTNGAPEAPASVSLGMRIRLDLASEKGAIVDSEYIIKHFNEIKKLPMEKVYVPAFVLNSLKKLVKVGRISTDVLENVEYLEKNAVVLSNSTSDFYIVVKTYAKSRSIMFAKYVLEVRQKYAARAVVLTKSKEVKMILEECGIS